MRAPAGCGVSRLRVNVCYLRQGERARIGDAHAFFLSAEKGAGMGGFFLSLAGCFLLAAAYGAAQTVHVIAKGETLFSLSRSYGVPLSALAQANNLANVHQLVPGQRIVVPRGYTVRRGDTLFSIARMLNCSLAALLAANGISAAHTIHPGDVLVIPPREKSPPTVAGADRILSVSSLPDGDQWARARADPVQTPVSPPAAVPAPERREISLRDPRQYISKKVDKNARWPVSPTSLAYVRGKTYGVVIDSERNAAVRALMSGKVISRGTHRGYGQVLFVESAGKHVYVYGGLERILPKSGDYVSAGDVLGNLGFDAAAARSRLYFMVYKKNKPIDPAQAPRGF